MKKTYVYFLVPLIGLIAFGALYWNFSSEYEAREAAKKAAIRQERDEKLAKEAKDLELAIKDALASQERRKIEKDIKVEKEAIAKIEADRKLAVDEQTFLKEYVKQAEANTKSLTEVLDKITAADKARAEAEAAAAKSAKNS